MSSVTSDRPLFYDERAFKRASEPLFPKSPREWQEYWLLLPDTLDDWRETKCWVQGRSRPVSCRLVRDGVGPDRACSVVFWERSGPGSYRIEANCGETVWDTTVEVEPETISQAAFASLLTDLARGLPASIALSLKSAGVKPAGVLPVALQPQSAPSLPEELLRLRHTVEGTPDGRPGLRAILRSIAQGPLTRLDREPQMRPVERALRPDLSRLGPLLATLPLDQRGRPERIVDMRPFESFDTPENRFIAYFTRVLQRRLRRLERLAGKVQDLDPQEVGDLKQRLGRSIRSFPQIADLRSRPTPPASQAMLRLAPYRQALRLWFRFKQSIAAVLDGQLLDSPIQALPDLYEVWGTLCVIQGTLDALRDANWQVDPQQRVFGKTEYGFGVRAFDDNRPVVTARSPDGDLRLELIPQAYATVNGTSLRALSHTMIPDVAILLRRGDDVDSVLVFDPKYKREEHGPVMGDIDAMHAYRDGIRGTDGRPIIAFAGIIYPGTDKDYKGQVGAISGIPGETSPSEQVRRKVETAISQLTTESRASLT